MKKIEKLKKAFLATASALTLTACGGGGGSGGVSTVTNFINEDLSNLSGSSSIISSYSSLLSSFQSTISGGNYSSLQAIMTGPNDEDISKATSLLGMLDQAEALWTQTETLIGQQSDADKYTIYNSTSYKEAYAALLYLKNHVKPVITKVANGKKITMSDYTLIATETKAQEIINTEKDSNANDYVANKLVKKTESVVVDTPTETIITGTASASNGDWSTVYQGGGQEKRTITTTTPKSKRIVTTRCTTPRTTLLNGVDAFL